jgi:hypothetical protein
MGYSYDDSDYVDVAARIAEFRDKYPDGRLRPMDPASPYRIETITGWDQKGNEVKQTFIVVAAAALRNADDHDPGVGMAYEVFPGRTNFTRGSELQNAETSAWGRAIVAALAADTKKGVASREEVRNRQAERDEGSQQRPRPAQNGLPRNKDGSVSHSQITDEQKAQVGIMTAEQMKEHTALQAKKSDSKTARAEGRVEKLSAVPDSDPWVDAPTGELNLPEPESQKWCDGWVVRVEAADSTEMLDLLASELASVKREGRIATPQFEHCKAIGANRKAELTAPVEASA